MRRHNQTLTTILCAAVVMAFLLMPVLAAAQPTITIYTDKDDYAPQETVEVSLSASNPNDSAVVDVYVGLLTSSGELFSLRADGWATGAGPWMPRTHLPPGFVLERTPLWRFDIPCDVPPIGEDGLYYFAAGLTHPGRSEFLDLHLAPFNVETRIDTHHYVNGETGDDSSDGSFGAPWKTITHALTVVSGSYEVPATIHVAAGTYSASTNGETFPLNMKSWVSLSGEGAPETIVDAEYTGYHVVYCEDVSGVSIDGVTITRGSTKQECSGSLDTSGAGICCVRSTLTVAKCSVIHNWICWPIRRCPSEKSDVATKDDWYIDVGLHGGGICSYESSLTVEGCTIADNVGEGVFCQRSSAQITNNEIAENIDRPGVSCEDSVAQIIGNTIEGNESSGISCERSSISIEQNYISGNEYGGIFHAYGYDSPSFIRDNTIVDNLDFGGLRTRCDFTCVTTIENNLIDGNAGGIECGGYELITNNVITNNHVDGMYLAGGINMHVASSMIVDNVIAFNSSSGSYASAVFIEYGAPILFNNLITANHCEQGGAAIYVLKAPFGEIAFNTIAGNYSSTFHYGIYCAAFGDDPYVWGNIIWGNGTPVYNTWPSGCCMDAQEDPTGGNILDPPMFVSGPLGDCYLAPESPCIDAIDCWASYFGLSGKTTQADGTPDTGGADMGFHYPIQ